MSAHTELARAEKALLDAQSYLQGLIDTFEGTENKSRRHAIAYWVALAAIDERRRAKEFQDAQVAAMHEDVRREEERRLGRASEEGVAYDLEMNNRCATGNEDARQWVYRELK
jgi:hypothetical protein